MKNIASALVKAQQAFGPALKTNSNPHFKSKYADLSACVEAVIDALNSNGIFLMQPTHECQSGVMVETIFLHESGEQMSAGKLHVPATKQDAQGYGSALTYARRYSLMSACGIAPEDDDGNAASKAKPRVPGVSDSFKSSGLRDENGVLAINSLPLDQQEYLRELAMELTELRMRDGADIMFTKLRAENLDNEQKLGLWSVLDSTTRAAIKSAEQKLKVSA